MYPFYLLIGLAVLGVLGMVFYLGVLIGQRVQKSRYEIKPPPVQEVDDSGRRSSFFV